MKSILILVLSCLICPVFGQSMAVKTNLASAAAGALHAGIEYAVSNKSSLELSYSMRPWKRTEGSVNRYWLVQPEYHFWTCQKFNGSFLGAYLNGAQFNVGGKKMPFGLFPELKEHRYSGWLAGAGFSYGYQLMLNRHWNLEAAIGVGYAYMDYTKYECPDVCAEIERKGHSHYFGPTKLSLSIVYIFN